MNLQSCTAVCVKFIQPGGRDPVHNTPESFSHNETRSFTAFLFNVLFIKKIELPTFKLLNVAPEICCYGDKGGACKWVNKGGVVAEKLFISSQMSVKDLGE